mmetsp:Transcript_43781/g.95301  ORF Transcript_43781/g.95301 Transcript_43781/m.95301 type:complete len:222 (-) Transcript_43781:508-1173(-)
MPPLRPGQRFSKCLSMPLERTTGLQKKQLHPVFEASARPEEALDPKQPRPGQQSQTSSRTRLRGAAPLPVLPKPLPRPLSALWSRMVIQGRQTEPLPPPQGLPRLPIETWSPSETWSRTARLDEESEPPPQLPEPLHWLPGETCCTMAKWGNETEHPPPQHRPRRRGAERQVAAVVAEADVAAEESRSSVWRSKRPGALAPHSGLQGNASHPGRWGLSRKS